MLYENKYRVESARFRDFDYRTPAWYFVTICIKGLAHTLGYVAADRITPTLAGEIAQTHLMGLAKHYSNVEVDRFVVMPNHVHALIRIVGSGVLQIDRRDVAPLRLASPRLQPPKPGSLSAIVRSYKAGVTQACRKAGLNHFEWQTGFHDKIVRSDASLDATRAYIEIGSTIQNADRRNVASLRLWSGNAQTFVALPETLRSNVSTRSYWLLPPSGSLLPP
jgi:putative transposase